jgi:spermidine synthase
LLRTDRKFDVITIDPPPPIWAAGSSLLYSREMYDVVKRRLRPGGILAQWFPGGDDRIARAVARSLVESFPYVVAYHSIEGWGVHYLAAMQPIPDLAAVELVARMPERARQDMLEWGPLPTAEAMMAASVAARIRNRDIVQDPLPGPVITDDRPFNEYYLLRRYLGY